MTKLKPCPFCGGEATMWDDGIYMPVIDPDTGAVVDCRDEEPEGCVIECKNCPAQIVENKKTGESEAELEQRAIKAWNRRDGEYIMRLIDADAAKAELLRMVGDIHGWGEFFDGIRSGYQSAADRLDTMPVVEERKHGHWLTKKAWHVECSECHHVLEFICDVKKYCPNCGAKMEGE